MDDRVKLNVGGCLYTTTRSTLTRYPDSMLAAMFSSELDPSVCDANGAYVIDGDGPIFRHVLNFLRRGKLILSEDFKEWDLLASEADYYQIEALVEAVNAAKPGDAKETLEYIEIHASVDVGYTYTGSRNALLSIPQLLRFFRTYIYQSSSFFRKVDGPDRQITCTLALRPVQGSRSDSQAPGISTFEVRGTRTTNLTELQEDFDSRKWSIIRQIEDLGFEMKTEFYSFFPEGNIAQDIRWTFARRVGPGLKTNVL